MADEVLTDVNADSSTAPDPAADPSQATTQPAQQNGGQFVPYDRFQQVNSRMHAAEQRALLLERQIAEEKAQRAQTGQTQPSQDEQAAVAALERLMGLHPKLKTLLENADKFAGVQQSVEQITEQQFQRTLDAGDDKIATFVKSNGLPASPQFTHQFQLQVGAVINANPQAVQRLRGGDLRVVDEACKYVLDFMGPVRQSATASVATTKLAQAKLPPRSTGGAPGASAPDKLSEDNETTYRRNMHSRAMGAWEDAQRG